MKIKPRNQKWKKIYIHHRKYKMKQQQRFNRKRWKKYQGAKCWRKIERCSGSRNEEHPNQGETPEK